MKHVFCIATLKRTVGLSALVVALHAGMAGAQTPPSAISSRQTSGTTEKEYRHYVDFSQFTFRYDRPQYAAWENEVQGFRKFMDIAFHQQLLSPARCYDYTFVPVSGVPRPDWQFFINRGTVEEPIWTKLADNAAGTVSPRVRLWISGEAADDRTVLRLSSADTAPRNNEGAAFLVVKELRTTSASSCLGIGSGNAGLVGFRDNAVVQFYVGP